MFCLWCIERFEIEDCKHYYRPQTWYEPEEREIFCPSCGEEILELEEYEKDDLLDLLRKNKDKIKDLNNDIQYVLDRYVDIVLAENEVKKNVY